MAMKRWEYANAVVEQDVAEGEALLSSSSVTTASDCATRAHEEGPRLFLAWSDGHELSRDSARWFPEHTGRDRGLWLLLGTRLRQQGWLRLAFDGREHVGVWATSCATYDLIKRMFDLAMAFVLLVLAAPLMLIAALLIRLDSPGPVLFCQERVGQDGKGFLLWKFRSMYADAPRYAPSPASDCDPRVTRVGRALRRGSVDELPQLINVLRGEMSLVGPRPEMPFIVEAYTSRKRQRLAVKPGITGLWQISPARAWPIHENLGYDLHYIRHRNLALDGAILLSTIVAVVRGVGAV